MFEIFSSRRRCISGPPKRRNSCKELAHNLPRGDAYKYVYEACCLFIVKAVCFGQIRTSPIVFQVRYVLGG